MVRRVIYTTNAIESLNYQLRKVTRNRGHFPSDEAAVKLPKAGYLQHRGQESPTTAKGAAERTGR
jgi:transposase, mutator family